MLQFASFMYGLILIIEDIARITLGLMNFLSLKMLRNAVEDVLRDYKVSRAFFLVSIESF
mgnify:CR=1 FL=1